MRYLIRVIPQRMEEVQGDLKALGVRIVKKVPPYVSVEAPAEMASRIEAIPGVVSITEEKVYRIASFNPVPVGLKLSKFLEMGGPFNPLALMWAAGFRKDRWPSSDSRKVLGADVADKMGVAGKGVKVAVLDSGFDLLGCPQKPTVDHLACTLEGDPFPIDNNGHGTHVLTTIAGGRFPTPWGWLEGVAKGVEIAAIKALGYGLGTASTSDVMEAIATAYGWGAKVVNMSLGSDIKPGEDHDPDLCPLCSMITALSKLGVIFVVAAGNSGEGYASCPGCSPGAVTIAALKKDMEVADFSSRQHPAYLRYRKPDAAAPGVDLGASSTGLIAAMEWVDGVKTSYISGTSMATPGASGLMALWIEYARAKGVELTASIIREILAQYGMSWNPAVGYGVPRFEMVLEYLGGI